jgi:predicted ATP-dependent protease
VRFIATAAHNNDSLPLDREAVAMVIAQASRHCESQRQLTLRFNTISNLLVEASWYARRAHAGVVGAPHIARAITERARRSSLIADKMHEDLLDGQVLLESEGARVGVVNGLAVLSVGEHDFGRPFRVTARVFAGQEGVVNIEHEAEMSGELHDKGVQILTGLLGHRFAQRAPLAMTATVTFEQSYGAVDGDSASSTWLYAILSALSGVPLDQGIGVTGSLNQLGEIQPVGGINHKVEGFFRFCEARGLTGRQGVMLPAQNVQHLMLEPDVRAAIAAGRFHIWPILGVDEGIELLTGRAAGVQRSDGSWPEDTVMGQAARRLELLREAASGDPGGGRQAGRRGGARRPRLAATETETDH